MRVEEAVCVSECVCVSETERDRDRDTPNNNGNKLYVCVRVYVCVCDKGTNLLCLLSGDRFVLFVFLSLLPRQTHQLPQQRATNTTSVTSVRETQQLPLRYCQQRLCIHEQCCVVCSEGEGETNQPKCVDKTH